MWMDSRNPHDPRMFPGYLILLLSADNQSMSPFMRHSKSKSQLFRLLTLLLIRLFQHLLQMAGKYSHHQIRLTPDYIQPFLCKICPLICASHWLAFAHILPHTALWQFLLHLLTYRGLLFPAFPGKLPATSTDKQLHKKHSFFSPVVVLTLFSLNIFHGREV